MKQQAKIIKKTIFVFKSNLTKRDFNTDPTVTMLTTISHLI